MKEFVSQLEELIEAEELLFDATPGFGSTYKKYLSHSIAHPAKMNTQLLEFLIDTFTVEGETVLDPMSGSGSTGVVAALHGRNAVCVELEAKFFKWMKQARIKVERQQTLVKKGKIRNVLGDARQLNQLLQDVDVVVTSPPYSGKERWQRYDGEKGFHSYDKDEAKNRCKRDYIAPENVDNIANLRHGKLVDVVVTSPPYSEAQDGHGIAKKGYRGNKHSPTDLVGNRSYMPDKFENPKNISRLKHGKVDSIITSPPYADSKKGEGDEQRFADSMEVHGSTKESRRERHTPGRLRAANAMSSGYSESEENIGNLKFDVAITSSPYGDTNDRKDRKMDSTRGIKNRALDLPKNQENIGNLKVDSIITSPPYEDAMSSKRHTLNTPKQRKIYEEKHWATRYEADVVITSPPYEAQNIRDISKEPYGSKLVGGAKRNIKQIKPYSEDASNIGNLKKETYLQAMLTVYREMWQVLKPDGKAIIIIKPFIRNKKVVDLPYQTWLLLKRAGFKLTKLFKLRLKQQSFWRILYHRKFPLVPQIKHEYVLVTEKLVVADPLVVNGTKKEKP